MPHPSQKISQEVLNQLFEDARTHNAWLDKDVSESLLKELFDLMIMGPTSANTLPARFVFVKSREAKEKLKPCLAPGNVDKTMSAPVCVIIGHDMKFYDYLPKLFPHTDAKSWFVGNDKLIADTAFRNGTLQGAYLILAARSLGLDCGPLSGFDNEKVDAAFFAGTSIKSNFLVNLGYGDSSKLYPRSPRFEFSEAAKIV